MRALLSFLIFISCSNAGSYRVEATHESPVTSRAANRNIEPLHFKAGSWQHFLQQLTVKDTPVVDYRGKQVRQQWKSAGVIPYDVGTRDLQQCADALMRLRAEYLFGQERYKEIGFHFVSGDYYAFEDYCAGKKPVPDGNGIRFVTGSSAERTHASLRKYLDLVYTYASTISLARDLQPAAGFAVGTIVVTPGSPGHCFMIIDEGRDSNGGKLYRLAESYTPAQSIYVLRNPEGEDGDPWHKLQTGTITTASYHFERYKLVQFE